MCEPRSVLLAGRKMIEHLLHALVEILDVLVGLVRERVAGRSSPDEFLGVPVEHINNQRAHLVGIYRCSRVSESPAPAPASSEAVVIGVDSLVALSHIHRHDCDITSRNYRRPS